MDSKNLKLKYNEIQLLGQRLVKVLRNTLWCIDCHEDVFSQQSSPVPSAFESLKGCNCPEKVKHRKRNLSHDQLNTMATELAVLLQSNASKREHLCSFKDEG